MHKEDIKGAIRKRWGSLKAFEEAHGLSTHAVSLLLRNDMAGRTEEAVLAFLREVASEGVDLSIMLGVSKLNAEMHRLNAGASQT